MRATGKFGCLALCAMALARPGVAQVPWRSAPTAEDVEATYPVEALRDRLSGRVALSCIVVATGALENCSVTAETPTGHGFCEAALALVARFAVDTSQPHGADLVGRQMNIPIRYGSTDKPWGNLAFKTSRQFPELAGPYYPDAAFRADANGEAILECRIGPKGQLQACKAVSVTPAGYGFDFAALKMAETGWITAREDQPSPPPDDGVWRFQVPFVLLHHLRRR